MLAIAETFTCPGETSPVSKAVHLGRLAAGWPGCAECRWRTESMQPLTTIRRTEFGVRGAYLNAIDRSRAAQLAAVLSTHLSNLYADSVHQPATEEANDNSSTVQAASPPMIAVGFDGRQGTPDLFAGVVSAVRQNGCHVLDAGQTSAAALLNVCRQHRSAFGAILVTGANAATSEVGLDVFLSDGQTTSIPWQDFGVGVRMATEAFGDSPAATHSEPVQQTLDRIRREETSEPIRGRQPTDCNNADSHATLLLPDLSGSAGRIFRSHRTSGQTTAVNSEAAYREWLLRWWPQQCSLSVEVVSNDTLTTDRLYWLTKQLSLNLAIRRAHEEIDGVAQPVLTIGEDDRFLSVRSPRGRTLSAIELADWMNNSPRTTSSHVTAHAGPSDAAIMLVDVAAPNSGRQQDVITDGIATAGFVVNLLRDGVNRLPS